MAPAVAVALPPLELRTVTFWGFEDNVTVRAYVLLLGGPTGRVEERLRAVGPNEGADH